MTSPVPQSGWYPDPSGNGGQRYFDGKAWTEHFSPPPPPQPSIVINNTNTVGGGAVIVSKGPNHALHLVLTLITFGLWLPVWVLVAIFSSGSRVQVAGAVSDVTESVGQVSGKGWRIIAAVLGGLVLLGLVSEHPVLLVPAAIIAASGYFGYREYQRTIERRADHANLAARADMENQAVNSGDPTAFYGQYPPPRLPPMPPPVNP
ncbi:DUF2510 domain-containing protein [Mycolicibacter sinensis]|uniref:DUF2510 domain-containing protein n=1 Tax=Mycolicibacter sinensis (strain JDM601) TaxID=875328 RepID=A0A1A3U7C6_MYCSD|nr:DUF2510 domain-containing protein [Mycolicibacter sinensis]OBK90815.1 hypothetical protein A5648_16430 [Mycolicibacter sinensis]